MIDSNTLMQEAAAASLRLAPPIGVTVATATRALDPQWFIAVPTALFIVMQAAYLFWKWRREARAKNDSA